MAQVLELPQLPEDDRVAEVEVGPARVAAELGDERFFFFFRFLQLLDEGILGQDLLDATPYLFELFFDGGEHGDCRVSIADFRLLGRRPFR